MYYFKSLITFYEINLVENLLIRLYFLYIFDQDVGRQLELKLSFA